MFNYRIKNGDTVCHEIKNTEMLFNKQYPMGIELKSTLMEQNIETDCNAAFSLSYDFLDPSNEGMALSIIHALENIKLQDNYNLIIEMAMHNNEDVIQYNKILETSNIDFITSGTSYKRTNGSTGDIVGIEEVLSFLFII